MAQTEKGIIYPFDYNEVADVPSDLKTLAESVDEAIGNSASTVLQQATQQATQNIEVLRANMQSQIDNLDDEMATMSGRIDDEQQSIADINTSLSNLDARIVNTYNKQQVDNMVLELHNSVSENAEEIDNINQEQTIQNTNISQNTSDLLEMKKLIDTELDTNTVEGTTLDVSDSAEYRGRIEVKGNTYQEQLSGKNLLDTLAEFPAGYSETIDGVKFTLNEDGTITANGTAQNNALFNYILNHNLDGAGKCICVQLLNGTFNGTVRAWAYGLNLDNSISAQANTNSTITKNNLIDGTSYKTFRLTVYAGTIINNATFAIMVVNTAETDLTYQSYCGGQPSPNPDYPQEIKVVTGDNVVKHADVFNDGKIEIGAYNDLSFQARARFTNSKIPIGTPITIETNFDLSVYKWAVYESTKPLPVTQQISTNTGGWHTDTNIVKYTTANQYVNLNIARIDNRNMTIDEISKFRVTMYAQHKEEYKLDLWKENEFDSENATVMNALLNDGGIISANGSYRTVVVSTLPDTLYKISKNSGAFFRIADFANLPQTNDEYISRIKDDNAQFILFKTSHFANYLAITYWNIADTISEQEMLESIKIQQPLELCKIDDYEDILFKNEVGDENYNAELENGAWYKKKVIDKKVLDDLWEWFMPATNRFHVNITLPDGEYDLVALCDKFINALYWPTHINTDKSFIVHNGNWGNNMCRISFVDKNCASLAEWTQFVSENNLIVYHRLLNPTYEKITDTTLISQLEALRKAKWYKGTNHWWTETENLEPNLKGTYKQSNNLRLQALEQAVVALGGV